MAGVEQCIVAIGSAFQGGAGLMQAIQERRIKTARHTTTEDPEQAYGERLLCKALAEGFEQCCHGIRERTYRFGKSFTVGDNIAMSELSLIMVNLQMQVISVLQHTASTPEVVLDAARLHEAVITAKSNTLRSMDELCQRIVYGTKKPATIRHSGSVLDFTHQNKSLYSIHDSVVGYRAQHNASVPLEASKQRRHTMTGIAESQHQSQNHWPSPSIASSCRSLSTCSSMSCRSSISAPANSLATPNRQHSIPEATPMMMEQSAPVLRRKSMRSALLRRPSKPTSTATPIVHPAYREKLHMSSTTALLAEKPEHVWTPVTLALSKAFGRVKTKCRKFGV